METPNTKPAVPAANSVSAKPTALEPRVKWLTAAFAALSLAALTHIVIAGSPFSFVTPTLQSTDPKRLASVVVSIVCQARVGDKILTQTGSGTTLLASGRILTNEHVVTVTTKLDNGQELKHAQIERCLVTYPDLKTGEPREMYWAKSIVAPTVSAEYDLAYLQIEDVYVDDKKVAHGTWPKQLPALWDADYIKLCGYAPTAEFNDPIRAFGYPAVGGVFSMTMTEGTVSGYSDHGMVKISAKIDHGHSGGMVVNQMGCMVGVPSAGFRGEAESFGLMIPTSRVQEFDKKLELLNELTKVTP